MRNSVIREMFKSQFCMRDCDQIDVNFLCKNKDGLEEFLIEDYVNHKGHVTLRRSILKIAITAQVIKSLN